MKLINYTSKISTDKTYVEITKILSEMGVKAIMAEYDDEQVMDAIAFRVNGKFGLVMYRLPANIDKIYKEIQNRPRYQKLTNANRTREQAARIAWRIIKDWIEAQMSLIYADQVDLEQVFLPYMQTGIDGETVYDLITKNGGYDKVLRLT